MIRRKQTCKRGHLRTPENLYLSGHCKQCTIRRQVYYDANNPRRKDYMRNYQLKRKYALSQTDYEHMWLMQGGKCSICREATRLVIDHNHSTGKIRGLLCNNCNALIGFAKESRDTLLVASGYVAQ